MLDDVILCQKSAQNKIAGQGKKSNILKLPQKFFNYVLLLYLTDDQINFAFISEN